MFHARNKMIWKGVTKRDRFYPEHFCCQNCDMKWDLQILLPLQFQCVGNQALIHKKILLDSLACLGSHFPVSTTFIVPSKSCASLLWLLSSSLRFFLPLLGISWILGWKQTRLFQSWNRKLMLLPRLLPTKGPEIFGVISKRAPRP